MKAPHCQLYAPLRAMRPITTILFNLRRPLPTVSHCTSPSPQRGFKRKLTRHEAHQLNSASSCITRPHTHTHTKKENFLPRDSVSRNSAFSLHYRFLLLLSLFLCVLFLRWRFVGTASKLRQERAFPLEGKFFVPRGFRGLAVHPRLRALPSAPRDAYPPPSSHTLPYPVAR